MPIIARIIAGVGIISGLMFCTIQEAKSMQTLDFKGIVVHHSGSNYDNFKSIDSYHRLKGWDCCGYHYVIEKDGQIFEGRPLDKAGAHALTGRAYSRNKSHIGICLCGNEEFSFEQEQALHALCIKVAQEFEIKSVERHHEACPGTGIDVEGLEKKILSYKEGGKR